MKKMQIRAHSGFTLIELLVVVLIIGILSAVALPQYRFAVAKAKVAQTMSLVRALKDAQERYYMANGEYSLKFEDLDISIPTPKSYHTNSWNNKSQSAKYDDFELHVCSDSGYVYSNTFLPDSSALEFGMLLDQKAGIGTKFLCIAKRDSMGVKLCKSYGGSKIQSVSSGYDYYSVPL